MSQIITPQYSGFKAVHAKIIASRYPNILEYEGFVTAQTKYPLVPSHPFGPVKVLPSGGIDVPTMLKQPTRTTRMVMDITRERFIADRIFTNAGGVTAGALVFDRAVPQELYTGRDIEQIAPGSEFPLVTTEQMIPETAFVEKWGAKTYILDEARDRNDTRGFVKLVRQMANTVVRKLNQRAIAELEKALAGGTRDIIGQNWAGYDPEVDPPQQSPAYDFGRAEMQAQNEEMGVTYNLWLINPMEALQLTAIYGPALNAPGMPSFYSSPRVPVGEAYVVQQGQVGEMRIEKPLYTTTWREEKVERTWQQTGVRPLWAVDNLYAVLKFKGLDGTV
jgi:hypothetical protein